ncbi:MAG: hypothetical protein GY711_19440 [bacterium]|nr:hypothetical protein [bacterium]
MSTSTPDQRRVPPRRKLAGLAIGTVLSLATLEGVLWILHALYAPQSRVLAALEPAPGERRILCMGDSNTYGVYLESSDSYPGRLQQYLDAAPDNPWRVFNLGYPGQNTAQMRARLAENLAAYRPEVLILWGGMNNTWSPAMSHLWDSPDAEPTEMRASLLDHSRALGALRMMFLEGKRVTLQADERKYEKSMSRAGDYAVPGLAGADRGEGLGDVESPDSSADEMSYTPEQVRRSIVIDLARIRAICDEHGVVLLLGQYWVDRGWVDTQINAAIDTFVASSGVPLVPLRERIRYLVDVYGFDKIQFRDHHARATGNREVARQMLFALMEHGMLEDRPEWTDVPPLEEHLGPPPVALAIERTARAGDLVEVRLTGPVRSRYVIKIEALGRGSERKSPITGHLDSEGEAYRRIQLPPERDDAGWRLVAHLAGDAEHAVQLDIPYESDR